MFGGCTGLRSGNFFTGKGNLMGEIRRVFVIIFGYFPGLVSVSSCMITNKSLYVQRL